MAGEPLIIVLGSILASEPHLIHGLFEPRPPTFKNFQHHTSHFTLHTYLTLLITLSFAGGSSIYKRTALFFFFSPLPSSSFSSSLNLLPPADLRIQSVKSPRSTFNRVIVPHLFEPTVAPLQREANRSTTDQRTALASICTHFASAGNALIKRERGKGHHLPSSHRLPIVEATICGASPSCLFAQTPESLRTGFSRPARKHFPLPRYHYVPLWNLADCYLNENCNPKHHRHSS